MTEEAKQCVQYCREWYQAFTNKGRGDEPTVKEFLEVADLIESLSAELEQTENKLSELLYYVTGGRFSETDYSTDDMRRFVEDYNQSVCSECDELEEIKQERDGLSIMLTAAESAAETYKRERDAAVEALQDSALCEECEHYEKSMQEEPCNACMKSPYCFKPNWRWRGVKED